MSDSFFKGFPKTFKQGLTVKELKELIKDWPEVNSSTGEPTEVWVGVGRNLSSPVTEVWPLNKRESSADLMFESDRSQTT